VGLVVAAAVAPVREPQAVRHFQSGKAAYIKGDYLGAVDDLTRALEGGENRAEVLFLRGRARQKLNDYSMAISDLERAMDLSPSGRTSACLGYCFARDRQHEKAICHHERAIQAGYATAVVYNNLGYSQLQQSKVKQAKETLDKSIALDPRLSAARHNRGMAIYQLYLRYELNPEAGIEDFREAFRLGPPTAELCRDAAFLAAAARLSPAWAQHALDYLDKAVDHGCSPGQFIAEPVFAPLREEPLFQALLTRTPGTPSQPAARLVDPVTDRFP